MGVVLLFLLLEAFQNRSVVVVYIILILTKTVRRFTLNQSFLRLPIEKIDNIINAGYKTFATLKRNFYREEFL